ncbi:hypothetical protein [Hymenobacter terricola]|uniref:hypothetical protein n=1 Tax=Hymenobacter terricola TaxID=2819236 RepID=UPI001B302DD0|nr:hypothetical protein [Hymenobacter terricola]
MALALPAIPALAQTPPEKTIVVSPAVGEVIDAAEKARFGLFPNYAADDFVEARFVRALTADSTITLRTRLRDGRQVNRTCLPVELVAVHDIIQRRLQELGDAAPVAAAPAGALPGPAAPVAPGTTPEVIGRSYSVELTSGNRFIGVLRGSTPQELEFETKDLGSVRVQRSNLKEFALLTTEQARRGFDDVGNGNRLFFGPTARNLRRGEGYVQNIDVFLLSANYGISDNFSMGVIATFIPEAGSDNLFGLTPKASFPVADKVRLGAGALVLFSGGSTAGVVYANGTLGSADNNLTAGLGYGFSGFGGFARTPVVMLGGATRLGRRISLLDETYLLHYSDTYQSSTGVGGIAGVRVAGPRISGSLGLMYTYESNSDTYYGYNGSNSYSEAYPYAEVTFRFGRVK